MTYVFIWVVSTSSLGAAMSSGTVEFPTEQACEAARKVFNDEFKSFPGTMRTVCLKKG